MAPFLLCLESNFFTDLKLHFKALQMHHTNKMSHYLIPSDTNVSRHLMKADEGGKAKLWKNSPEYNTGWTRWDLECKGGCARLFHTNLRSGAVSLLVFNEKGLIWCLFLISSLDSWIIRPRVKRLQEDSNSLKSCLARNFSRRSQTYSSSCLS